MTPDDWQQARRILEVAVRQPPRDRRRCVQEECGENVALRHEIEALLASYDDASSLEDFLLDRQARRSSDSAEPDITRTATSAGVLEQATPIAPATGVVQWGKFTLLDELGRGGFGVVHRAWDPALRREIALKIIDVRRIPGTAEDAWLREGQLLARVDHTNVVRVYSVERIGHEIGLAMQLIKGRLLSNLVAQHGPLSADEAIPIGMALCDALAAIHRVGLVHRDVKASNVMRESGGRIVLLDFGAGRELAREATTHSAQLGTPAYMPPEVLRGEAATVTSDLYSLGVLLYYLVSGRYPVAGASFAEVHSAHARSERLPLPECRPDLPSAFVDLVERATSSAPADRPATAVEFRRELERLPRSRRLDSRRERSGARSRIPGNKTIERSHGGQEISVIVRGAAGLAGASLLLTGVGFFNTLEYNHVMGRTPPFADGDLPSIVYGVQSAVGPAIYIALLLGLLNAVLFLGRITSAFVPSIRAQLIKVRNAARDWFERSELNDRGTLVSGFSVLSLIGLLVTLWSFHPLLYALVNPIDTAPPEVIALLSRSNVEMKVLYRRCLELNLVLLVLGGLTAVRLREPRRTSIAAGAWVAYISAAGLVLLFLLAPWRVLFGPGLERVEYASGHCYLLGRDPSRQLALLHCPSLPPPRNATIPAREIDSKTPSPTRPGEAFDDYVTMQIR